MQITPIAAFSDNYIWALIKNNKVVVVDPGEAKPVIHFLEKNKLTLDAILVTHWHHDHTGGIDELLLNSHHHVPVYGPNNDQIVQITHRLADGEKVSLLDSHFEVISVPGHTLDHIAYYSADNAALFCGDTLFAGGCGRIFEGNAAMMYNSLKKLMALPEETRVYCAHEYTVSNLYFCCAVEPENSALKNRLSVCEQLRQQKQCTLPSTIKDECMTNCFLRTSEEAVITSALKQGAKSASPVDVFSQLREWKNNF